MFGRRNPERAPELVPPKPNLELDMLDDLPIVPEPAASQARAAAAPTPEPAAPEPEPDPAWYTATPALLGPSVTQLLREAATSEQPSLDTAITQQLPVLEIESEPAPPPALWASEVGAALPTPATTLWGHQPPEADDPPAIPTLRSELGFDPNQFWPAVTPPTARLAPEPAPAEAPAAMPSTARANPESVIGPDDFFDGHYRSERGVRIQGNAHGSIESRQYILVEAGATVQADLTAQEIMVAGDFSGKISCHGRLEIMQSGAVQGVIETAALIVHEGGRLEGELHMRKPTE